MKSFNVMNLFNSKALLAASLIAITLNSSCGEAEASVSDDNKSETASAKQTSSGVKIGEPLKTEYFEVTVKSIKMTKTIKGEFTEDDAGEDAKYLVIDTKFKNISDESRLLVDGELFVTVNGKEYKFDMAETVMADGYGLLLDQISPLTSKSTKIVYKVPQDIKGPAYYKPGRADSDEKIFLGDLQ